jgi:predicted nucleic acid-binding protein
MPKALLDTNVFIFSIEHPRSNSNIIIEMAFDGEIDVVISVEIKLELLEYLKREYGRDASYKGKLLLESIPKIKIVTPRLIKESYNEFKDRISDKDLPHLIAAELSKAESIVTYDRDFKNAKTKIPVYTPKEYVKHFGIKPFTSEY